MPLFHSGVTLFAGFVTVAVTYALYRKKDVSFWGFTASFFPDMPVFLAGSLGATNLGTTLFVSHTLGLLIFPIFLVIIDILLMEIAWIRYLTWLPYPKIIRALEKLEFLIEKLEKYNTIPRPIRVGRVFMVSVLAGMIHLIINLMIGML